MLALTGCSLQKAGNASDEIWGCSDAKEIDINSKVAGRVIQLNVKEGDSVNKGDIIAYIDQRDLLAQKSQAEANIKAPYDGIITAKYIEEGSMISLGTPLVALQDPLDNWVNFKLPETKLRSLRLNQQVSMIARDGQTKVTGTIIDISKKSEFATQRATSERGDDTDIISFNVKVQVNDSFLRPGLRFRLLVGDEE